MSRFAETPQFLATQIDTDTKLQVELMEVALSDEQRQVFRMVREAVYLAQSAKEFDNPYWLETGQLRFLRSIAQYSEQFSRTGMLEVDGYRITNVADGKCLVTNINTVPLARVPDMSPTWAQSLPNSNPNSQVWGIQFSIPKDGAVREFGRTCSYIYNQEEVAELVT